VTDSPTGGASATKRRAYSRHGLNALKARVKLRGSKALDRRTSGAQELIAWRTQVVADLGGEKELTAAKAALLDAAAKTWLYIRVLDTWILEQRAIVNLRRRSLLPVVRERQQLVDSFARLLGQLGFERRARPAPELAAYLAQTYGGARTGAGSAAEGMPNGGTAVDEVCMNGGRGAEPDPGSPDAPRT